MSCLAVWHTGIYILKKPVASMRDIKIHYRRTKTDYKNYV
jgi:hypothetical protein